ncbi:MAG: hybrid sensor histidine kinase/response regulator [Myxococcales bacterium]
MNLESNISAPVAAGSSTRTVKLLLVDDLEENLLALAGLIDEPDIELLQARSGEEALEILLEHEVALALIDVQMPEMDGFELAELMRGVERTRHVPIIFVTAGAHSSARIFRGYDAGAVDILFKPIDAKILKHKVNTFVSLYRQRLQLAEQVDKIQQLNEELAATLALNERFVAAVGHDLRTPLSNVLMASDNLRFSATAEQNKQIDRIKRSAHRMVKMIEELFDLARARQSGGIPVTREDKVNLLQVTERALGELRDAAPERSIAVCHAGNLEGQWDSARLCQVVSNLLGNALRHGTPGTPVDVRLDGTRHTEVRLEVENGGEISPEVLPMLFEPFRRGSSPKSSDGLGLGLFIVQQVVAAHGGAVQAHSNGGTTKFEVRLPRGR